MNRQNLKLSAISIALLFLASSAFAMTDLPGSKQKWVTYKSDVEKIKIKFPGEIDVIDEILLAGQHHIIAKYQPSDEIMFSLDVVLHNDDMNASENFDEVSPESFFAAMGVDSVQQEDFYLEKHKGLKAIFIWDDLGITIDYRVIMIGQQQIMALVIMKNDKWDQKTVDKFFKSLKLLK